MLRKLTLLCAFLLLFACSISHNEQIQVADKQHRLRQGEEVEKVCFPSSTGRWQSLDGSSHSFIIDNYRQKYKVDLTSTCDVQNAHLTLGAYGFSHCLKKGDPIIVKARHQGTDRCHITHLYQWLPKQPFDTDKTVK